MTESGDQGCEIIPVWRDMSDMDEEPRTPVREKLVGATNETKFVEEFLSLSCPGLKTGEERIKEVDAEEGQSKVLFTSMIDERWLVWFVRQFIGRAGGIGVSSGGLRGVSSGGRGDDRWACCSLDRVKVTVARAAVARVVARFGGRLERRRQLRIAKIIGRKKASGGRAIEEPQRGKMIWGRRRTGKMNEDEGIGRIYLMGTKVDHEYGKKVHESIRLLIEAESVRRISPRQANATICMVPDTLRNLNPTAYTPRITSIGPLHKQDHHLRAMEEHKVTYMYRLFSRTEEFTKKGIEHLAYKCVQATLGLLTRVKSCYASSLTTFEDFKLAKMMVIDGCFILELLYRYQHGIVDGDPIFDNVLVMRDVMHDLLLLENQMPFFVLEILFSITMKRILGSTSLPDLVFYFFKDINILNNTELRKKEGIVDHCHTHILGLLQSCYRPRATIQGIVPNISYSATEIAGAGVTFKAQKDEGYLLAVNLKESSLVPGLSTLFGRETCFEIPELCIKDSTPSFLRNLIAYEQCYPLSRHYVTSFAFLMDRLIDTKDDASLLVTSKVLQHKLGAIDDVTDLFNNICNGVVVRDFYYTEEWKQLDEYCNRFWPSQWTRSGISVVRTMKKEGNGGDRRLEWQWRPEEEDSRIEKRPRFFLVQPSR
ncbi:hypothetical protein LXL04_019131 [Taraxacum kok-saghyz]